MTKQPRTKEPEAPKAPPAVAAITNDQKNLAFICHLSGLFWFIVPGLNIIIPLLVMLIKGNEDPFVSHHSRQALIFQVIMSVAMMLLLGVGLVLLIVLVGILFLVALVAVAVVDVVFILIATFAAARGEWYSYPLMGRV
jgi:hypothetical protein